MKSALPIVAPAIITVAIVYMGSVHAAVRGATEVRAGEDVVYVGAVLEYEPYNQWTVEGGEGIVRENARIISEYATQAKDQGADILVAPEYGIQSLDMHSTLPEEMFSVTQYVPDPDIRIAPCAMNSDADNFEAIRMLSCAALFSQIYLVADLAEASPCNSDTAAVSPFPDSIDTSYVCPPRGYFCYNTQVVFDRNGTVVARYRKKNLFLEPQFHPGNESDDTAIFTTDFGVTFSLQVCFDIAFVHPGLANVVTRGVRDVVMSTAWVDSLPFLIATSVQNGWSRGLGTNLLVSGHHRPEMSKLGSGIYLGFSDFTHQISYDSESGNRLIVSEVKTIAAANGVTLPHQPRSWEGEDQQSSFGHGTTHFSPRRNHLVYHDDLSNYTQTVLARNTLGVPQEAEVCHQDGLCCSLTYSTTSNLTYSLIAYSGIIVQGFHSYKFYAQVCSVVWCQAEDVNSCAIISEEPTPDDEFGPFTLSGSFSTEYVYPAMFDRNLAVAMNDHYSISVSRNNQTLSTQEPSTNPMTAGFYGRWYERDP